jgi:hypothetical protein
MKKNSKPEVKKSSLLNNYVFMETVEKALDTSFATNQNIVLYGKGGFGKSEFIKDYLQEKGLEPFVFTMGSGTTTDRLFGGTDLKNFIGENANGKIEYLVENSFMNHEVVVFEELFDAPDFILEQLKDILSSKIFRNGSQVFPIKTKQIICATNKTREEFGVNLSLKALLERFPLEIKVEWKAYDQTSYEKLLVTKTGFADPLLINILQEFSKANKPVSPRIALEAAKLLALCGPDCLEFIAEFNQEKELFSNAVKKFNNLKLLMDESVKCDTYIKVLEKPLTSLSTIAEFEDFKFNLNSLKKVISTIKALKINDENIDERNKIVSGLESIINTKESFLSSFEKK